MFVTLEIVFLSKGYWNPKGKLEEIMYFRDNYASIWKKNAIAVF